MLLNLVVGELEHLQTVWEGCLSGLSICKVVDNALIRVGLLYVVVVEVDYGVSIWENLSLHSVVEDHFLFAIFVKTLDFSIVTYYLLNDFQISWGFVVILLRELHVIVLLLVI